MFKPVSTSLVAVTFASLSVQASKSTYRPTQEQAPWYYPHNKDLWQEPAWPVNYVVPNFGPDRDDVLVTQNNLASVEKNLGKKLSATFDPPKPPPRDYFVPNFGQDSDIKLTSLDIAEAEAQHGHQLTVPEKAKEIPRDYFVPNFGQDKDILATKQHLAEQEKLLNHKLSITFDSPKPPPRDYFVPNFGMDSDIVNSLANTEGAEASLNHVWNVKAPESTQVQLQEDIDESIMLESDPICSSGGCTQYNHPKKSDSALIPRDYFVPNFGKDSDMTGTMNSLNIAEG